MTPNEITLVKHFIDTLEKKNDQIVELSIAESQNKIDEVKENWQKRFNTLMEEHEKLVQSLRENGYINDEMRKKYDIVK